MWPEDELYTPWLEANAAQRTGLERELCLRIKEHAEIVVWRELNENEPDLVQDIVMTVFQHLPDFRREALFSTWMHKIAENKVHQEIRRRQRYRRRFVEEPNPNDGDNDEGREHWRVENPPDTVFEIDNGRLRNELTRNENILLDFKYEGMTDHEIANRFAITVDAAESRWRRLRTKLQKMVGYERRENATRGD
jgi:RNA polymerase sigma-70 factor (ECF subfamily)